MPLPLPNLDDRDYEQLRSEALEIIKKNLDTDWTDLSPSDPGIVLLEAFAFLTEQMIYRLNRLPEKVYIAFLRMLGVTINPPKAASVWLKVWHRGPGNETLHLPCGSQVTTSENGADGSGDQIIFTTVQDVSIPAENNSEEKAVSVRAYQCEWVEESLGKSKIIAGKVYQVRRPSIIAQPYHEANWLKLAVGVEADDQARLQAGDRIGLDGKFYHLWNEVKDFSDSTLRSEVYMLDRQAGLIQFAPAVRAGDKNAHDKHAATVQSKEREIRVWYPRGGGAAGNVRARQLTRLAYVPDQAGLPALEVTNPKPASGGLDAGTLEDALACGPQKVFAQRRAVTAHEFESVVLENGMGQISRAHALAQASLWKHGIPGTVDIVLVPDLNHGQAVDPGYRVSQKILLDNLLDCQKGTIFTSLEEQLKERSTIGTGCYLRWARYKQVEVHAEVTCYGNGDPSNVKNQIVELLNQLISPLPAAKKSKSAGGNGSDSDSPYPGGWPFGKQLRVADIYNQISLAKTKVPEILITSLDLKLEHAPNKNVTCLAADYHQPETWYAGSDQKLFRSTNNGSGWELILHLNQQASRDLVIHRSGQLFRKIDELADHLAENTIRGPASRDEQGWVYRPITRDENIRHVCPSPDRRGLVALSSEAKSNGALESSLYLSLDCGEHWYQLAILQEKATELNPGAINDMAWLLRGGCPVLLLATDGGLLEVNLDFNEDGCLRDVDFFQVPILEKNLTHSVIALTVVRPRRGNHLVVTALKGRHGVLYKATGDSLGYNGKFDMLVIKGQDLYHGEDIRHLNVQYLGNQIYLWAAAMAVDDQGQGCIRWSIDQAGKVTEPGIWVSKNWRGGSCLALAFDEFQDEENRAYAAVYAATAKGGLLRATIAMNKPDQELAWEPLPLSGLQSRKLPMQGLRHRDVLLQRLKDVFTEVGEEETLKQFQKTIQEAIEEASTNDLNLLEPLTALDARYGKVMAACKAGIFRREKEEQHFNCERYENVSRDRLSNLKDAVTIPADWLLISGSHQITVTIDPPPGDFGAEEDAAQKASDDRLNTAGPDVLMEKN